MPEVRGRIESDSAEFRANRERYDALLATLRERVATVVDGGRERQIARHRERGKLLPRERIDLVVDEHSPFLELSTLAAHGRHGGEAPGGGIVTGIGVVHGVPCMFIANDATVKGGTLLPESIKKHYRAQRIAIENRLPCIYLVDSGGAFLPLQDEVFPDEGHFGGTFYQQTTMSAAGLPQLSVVLGGCTAGGAYVPALSDEAVIVKGIGRIYLGGPPIVKAALSEIIEPEDLGGADLHTRESGVADYLAHGEEEAYVELREIVEHLNWPRALPRPPRAPEPPLHDPAEIPGFVPCDERLPWDVRGILARLLDGSRFHEFKPLYGSTLVCGTGWIYGWPVGILVNDGILFSESALKATHFIEMMGQRGIPLVFLQNTTGYMVGRDAEARGIAKDGAKMVNAVSNAAVPKFTIVMGGSYGAGNYGMCGRGFRPRFLFAWSTARVATMSAETAKTVLVDVKRGGIDAERVTEEEIEKLRARVAAQYETQSDPYYATARIWDDGLIEPADTRDVLGLCLALAAASPEEARSSPRVFRM
jgi:3-methylcrotonyl-CoA carboxylase beta subunit